MNDIKLRTYEQRRKYIILLLLFSYYWVVGLISAPLHHLFTSAESFLEMNDDDKQSHNEEKW